RQPSSLPQRPDPGPPAPGPVLNPPQKPPGRDRPRAVFAALPARLEGPRRIAALRVRAVDQGPTLQHQGNAEVGDAAFAGSRGLLRIDGDDLAEALDRLVIFLQIVAQDRAEVDVP